MVSSCCDVYSVVGGFIKAMVGTVFIHDMLSVEVPNTVEEQFSMFI